MGPETDIFTPVLTAALVTISQQVEEIQVPIKGGLDKQVCNVHRMECHSASKSMEILTNAIT